MVSSRSCLVLAGIITLVALITPTVLASGSGAGSGGFEKYGYDMGRSIYSSTGSNAASFYETDPEPTLTPVTDSSSLSATENQTMNQTAGNLTTTVNQTPLNAENGTASQESAYSNLAKYNSLGDIIRAGDWVALDEYKQKMHEENSALLDSDADALVSSNHGNWESRFHPREIIVSCAPCG